MGVVTGTPAAAQRAHPERVAFVASRARRPAAAPARRGARRTSARGSVVSDAVHVAFDLGAESGRAMVGRFDGARLELEEVRRFPTPVRAPARRPLLGCARALRRADVGARRRARARARTSAASASTPGASTSGCSTRAGALLANPLSYRDGRGARVHRRGARARARRGRSTRRPASSSCRSTRSSSCSRSTPAPRSTAPRRCC